jgi:hypothetical protein
MIRRKVILESDSFEMEEAYNDLCNRFQKSGSYTELDRRSKRSAEQSVYLQSDLEGMFKVSVTSRYVSIIHITFYSTPSKWILKNIEEYNNWLDDYAEAYGL